MALVPAALAAARIAAIKTIPGIVIVDEAELSNFFTKDSEAIITYLVASTTVVVATPGAQAGAVTLPGTGTIS